jgi:hypothetical protein
VIVDDLSRGIPVEEAVARTHATDAGNEVVHVAQTRDFGGDERIEGRRIEVESRHGMSFR